MAVTFSGYVKIQEMNSNLADADTLVFSDFLAIPPAARTDGRQGLLLGTSAAAHFPVLARGPVL